MTIQQPEVCVGCGLNVTPDGTLRVRTGGVQWPYDCRESEGQPIYCGSDGIIRTRPIPYHRVVQQFASYPANRLLNGGSTPTLAATIANPSDCLAATVVAFGWTTARYQVTPGNRWEISVRTFRVGDDAAITVPIGAGRGAPGGSFQRVLVTDGPVGRDQMITVGGGNNAAVRRVTAGAADAQENNLVQSDTAVSVRDGSIFSNSGVSTEQAMVGPAVDDYEGGLVNAAPRPRRFRLDPGQQLTYRLTVVGTDGSSGDTFNNVNTEILLMLSTMPGTP